MYRIDENTVDKFDKFFVFFLIELQKCVFLFHVLFHSIVTRIEIVRKIWEHFHRDNRYSIIRSTCTTIENRRAISPGIEIEKRTTEEEKGVYLGDNRDNSYLMRCNKRISTSFKILLSCVKYPLWKYFKLLFPWSVILLLLLSLPPPF